MLTTRTLTPEITVSATSECEAGPKTGPANNLDDLEIPLYLTPSATV